MKYIYTVKYDNYDVIRNNEVFSCIGHFDVKGSEIPIQPKPIRRDANHHGVSWPDYIGHQLPCECGGELVDAGYATEETILECQRCGRRVEKVNTSYHSDHPDAKLGSPDFNNEPDPNEILEEIAHHDWGPRIPKTRKALWDLQKHLSMFRKIAKNYNSWLKSMDKDIRYLKSKKKRNKKEERHLAKLFEKKRGRRFVSGLWVFDTYCDMVGADSDAASWITHNWESLNIKDDYKKPDLEDRMPMAINEDGEWEEREFRSDAFTRVVEHTRYTNEEIYIIGYVAKMLIKRPYICAKKIIDSACRTRIKVYLLDLIDIVLEVGLEHPSTTRWKRWNGMTRAKFEAEVEAAERQEEAF